MTGTSDSVIVFEFAENGMIGVVTAVHDHTFEVNGATVQMNDDPRFPSAIIDVFANPGLPVSALVVGGVVSIDGYFDDPATPGGTLTAILVSTDIDPGALEGGDPDIVTIDRVRFRGGGRLRVSGFVQTSSGATSLTAYVCTGCTFDPVCAGAGRVPVGNPGILGDGSYSFRNRNITGSPTDICMVSNGGGSPGSATQSL